MIISFKVGNYLSFNETVSFGLAAGDVRTKKNHTFSVKGNELLKFSVLYGANGAGKSNLIKSIEAMSELIQFNDLKSIARNRHRLSAPESNTIFEMELLADSDEVFVYGVELSENFVVKEYATYSELSSARSKLIFERSSNKKGNSTLKINQKFINNSKDKSLIDLYETTLLDSDALFLTTVVNLNNRFEQLNEVLDQIFKWFHDTLRIIHPQSKPTTLLFNLSTENKFLEFSNNLLRTIDAGITKLDIHVTSFDDFFGQDENSTTLRNELIEDLEESQYISLATDIIATKELMADGTSHFFIKRLRTIHKTEESDKEVVFNLREESDGTRRVIEYLSLVYEILDPEVKGVYIVDEMERSIHPHLLKEIIKKLVNSDDISGQLIFSTHESTLLDLELFRKDEVWLVEKNKMGSSGFTRLSEFKIRNDLDIQNNYLNGRFGGIPILTNFKDLNWLE